MKRIYVIRHCEAQGQSSYAPLTERGQEQAKRLADFFYTYNIDRIISSPYLRAIQSIELLSKRTNKKIELDDRLSERTLSTDNLPDWYEKLKITFTDLDLKYEGGESSQEAMTRIKNVVNEVVVRGTEQTVIVSHGNLISLLVKSYQSDVDFQFWQRLSNPDVYQISYIQNEAVIERIWNDH
ncbi:histidine phosphatase family protein [Lysinibacillus sp. CD3-6]|uniref:histidine phosphatase family protein n=1 Tax=Lysinibacillus sp. CD3-6 TaxID=2892541 RepID=UPI0011731875|nr:histidine phosphatase family protein [Lysinibacillus sp. CD3-6]UED80114.1 histidine phosphatase family protein [Lysinibacillus sp. CD3-6]